MSNILIVGANQGIGYYMVIRLLEKGNKVAVLDIQDEHISEWKDRYQDSLFVIKADATDEESLSEGIEKTIKEFGNIDIAIHNACLCTFVSEQNTDYEVYKKVMDVNYFGALRLSKLVLPFMRERKQGRIIFTSSGVGVTGFGNISPYASSKGAIEALAKCLEIENREYGITFHIMHPPLTNTASSSGLPVPKEFMADAEKVGRGLADNICSKKFVICHSFSQSLQMKLCYRHPLYMGKMMWKMTQRAKG
ncbi:MAG: SDR family oxidoreductase [Lachnospiraceae bacterium]|nr:SDR family oxidoreductase [Lachnospiraceae bacterium]